MRKLSSLACVLTLALFAPLVARAQANKEEKIPEPEDISLETKDGVQLRCTWYPGTLKKQAIPFIMLHGWEGQRGEFEPMALGLQKMGHAVLCPDLRGHGQSMTRKIGATETEELDGIVKQPKKLDLESMVLDVEACKKFLREKNNQGELNIEQLCLVASDFSCIVALRWAAIDWSARQIASYKQGQDVKAVVLLSPVRTFKGLTVQEALAHPDVRSKLSIMIVAGKQDNKSYSEAKRLHTSFENFHPKKFVDDEDRRTKMDLFLVEPDTSLAGTKLLQAATKVPNNVANFVNLRLVAKEGEYSWSERKNPLSN
jgi:pimeloyl-ACP methyl ester carboxylesterase